MNKNYLLIKVVFHGVKELFVKKDNTTGCQTSKSK
jgi:hypothetical protein